MNIRNHTRFSGRCQAGQMIFQSWGKVTNPSSPADNHGRFAMGRHTPLAYCRSPTVRDEKHCIASFFTAIGFSYLGSGDGKASLNHTDRFFHQRKATEKKRLFSSRGRQCKSASPASCF